MGHTGVAGRYSTVLGAADQGVAAGGPGGPEEVQ